MKTLLAAGVLGAAIVGSVAFSQDDTRSTSPPVGGELRAEMRKLWEDHSDYSRHYLISTLAGLPDADEVSTRLLKNQDDIGDAIKPYYGDDAGGKLSSLLRDHVKHAAETVQSAKTGRKGDLEKHREKWSAHGKNIAAFLSGANPAWKKSALEDMLQKQLDLTMDEVAARLKKDWAADLKAHDQARAHLMKLADLLTEGIVAAKPDKFKS